MLPLLLSLEETKIFLLSTTLCVENHLIFHYFTIYLGDNEDLTIYIK